MHMGPSTLLHQRCGTCPHSCNQLQSKRLPTLPRSIAAPTLFATHFHELTDISGPGGVANLHVGTRIEPDTGAGAPMLACRVAQGGMDTLLTAQEESTSGASGMAVGAT